jgi:hypothetical protein
MKKGRTSTKSKGNLAAEVARVEEKLEWGLNDQTEDVAAATAGAPEPPLEPEMGGGVELRHPQL